MPDERELIVAHIEGKTRFCEARENDGADGAWYKALARVYRTLAEDIRQGFHR